MWRRTMLMPAVKLINAKFKALDPKGQLGTFVQAGHVLMTYDIDDQIPEGNKIIADVHLTLTDAEQILKDGEQSGTEDDQLNYKNLMGELGLCYALEGNDSWYKAKLMGIGGRKNRSILAPQSRGSLPRKRNGRRNLTVTSSRNFRPKCLNSGSSKRSRAPTILVSARSQCVDFQSGFSGQDFALPHRTTCSLHLLARYAREPILGALADWGSRWWCSAVLQEDF